MAKVGRLRGLRIPTQAFSVPGNDDPVVVRGLSFSDISVLVEGYAPELKRLFDEISGDVENLDNADVLKFAKVLFAQVPDMAAVIIALAADEPDAAEQVKSLPFPLQVEMVEAIALLTFSTQGGPKKVVETVLRLVAGVNGLIADLKA